MKWYVVEQSDQDVINHEFKRLKDAKEWLMEQVVFTAWNEWRWPCNFDDFANEDLVNEILTEMKAYNLFFTILPEPLLGSYNLKDWRNADDRSTFVYRSFIDQNTELRSGAR